MDDRRAEGGGVHASVRRSAAKTAKNKKNPKPKNQRQMEDNKSSAAATPILTTPFQ